MHALASNKQITGNLEVSGVFPRISVDTMTIQRVPGFLRGAAEGLRGVARFSREVLVD